MTSVKRTRLGVVQHQDDAPAGLLEPWAAARGFELRVARADRGEPLPAGVDALVVLGSDGYAIRGEREWIDAELDALAERAREAPVLGICFGAQALSVALGGGRRRAPAPEIGWIDVAPGAGIVAGTWLAWHDDVIDPPPGATVISRNPFGVQAFGHGPHLGVQFHPEVTPGILARWAGDGGRELARAGIDADALVAETRRRATAAAAAAHRLFDAFALRAGLFEPALSPP